jgi:hypothetical protein
MLKGKKRQMVLDYLYQECVANSRDSLGSRKRMTCKLETQLRYEHIPQKEKIKIYKTVINQKIIEYLMKQTPRSLGVSFKENLSERRLLAEDMCVNMKKNEKIAICERIGLEYL